MLVVVALPAERAGLGPGLDDQIVRLLEPLAVEGRVDAGRELLLPAAADEARDQPALRDHVDHRQFLGELYRIVGQRQGIAEQDDLRLLRRAARIEAKMLHLRLHAERRVMVLVEHDAVEAELLGIEVMVEVFVIEPAARDRVEILVREHQRGVAESQPDIRRIGRHRLLGEIHQMHGVLRMVGGAIEEILSQERRINLPLARIAGEGGTHRRAMGG